jgi:NAD dependent epimerase/dehydratase family enzyme
MVMTKGQHVIPKRVLDYGYEYYHPEINSACASLAGNVE